MAQWNQQCLCSPRTQVKSPVRHSRLKDMMLPQLWHRSQLQVGFDSWSGNSIRYGVEKKKKEEEEEEEKRSSHCGSAVRNPNSIHEDVDSIPELLTQQVKDLVSHRCVSDPTLLWCRPAATAPTRPLAWELPYAKALEMAKRPKQNKTKKEYI